MQDLVFEFPGTILPRTYGASACPSAPLSVPIAALNCVGVTTKESPRLQTCE
jgi:hypothetical protein